MAAALVSPLLAAIVLPLQGSYRIGFLSQIRDHRHMHRTPQDKEAQDGISAVVSITLMFV